MADPLSDPALLFSPSRLSPLTSEPPDTPSPSPRRTVTASTRRNVQIVVAPPRLSPSIKALYEPTPFDLGGDPEFVRDDLDAVVGEFPLDGRGKPSHYFVRFKDGLARRISSHTFLSQYTDFVDEYHNQKAQGLLAHFDPASDDVHEYSRIDPINPVTRSPAFISPFEDSDTSLSPLSDSFTEEDDDGSDDEDYSVPVFTRQSARLAASDRKPKQSKLPFSPKKLRTNRVQRGQSVSGSGDELGGYGQIDSDVENRPRRSTRTTRSALTTITDDLIDDGELDDDDYLDSPQHESWTQAGKKVRKKASAMTRPAYGYFRDMDDLAFDFYEDDGTLPLRAHRDICERCHKHPAPELLMKAKKSRRKIKSDEHQSDDDEDHIQTLGGWVRCLKCPVVAHWKCLARTQRDEITRAARARDTERWTAQGGEPSPVGLPSRKELGINQTTEFICGMCMKGGICMGCLEMVLEPDPSLTNKLVPRSLHEPAQGDASVVEMGDDTSAIVDNASLEPPRELLFRCFSCRRLAHYRHLPDPDSEAWEDADLASYYQEETDWRCADCASYVYPLDKILAWRPYPPGAVEHPSANPADAKSLLPREYLIKWADRSYRRTQWVPHMWLVSTNLSKLKHFLAKGSKVQLLNEPVSGETAMDVDKPSDFDKQPLIFEPSIHDIPELGASVEPKRVSLGPLLDAERRIPPAWKTIERVLDVRFWNPQTEANGKHKKSAERKSHSGDTPLNLQHQLERAYEEGEQPDESFMEELDEWESSTGEALSVEYIDQVIWVFVKWEDLGYEEATWDSPPRRGESGYGAYERAFLNFIASQEVHVKKMRKDINRIESREENGYSTSALKRDTDEQPDLGQAEHLKLMRFQIDGYNWICDNWWNRQPSILADEMGLGKTVQIVMSLGTLIEKFEAAPVLVVVPNSTIVNWVREFSRWAPRLRVVSFFGEAKSRDVVLRYELFHARKHEPKYHVLITTYETVTNPKDFGAVFKSVGRWEILVVDEGQRLKSDRNLLFKKLNELKPIHRVIMTGTPLNNNIRELFNLMNFLDPDQWQDLEALEKEYEELSEDLVRQLHARLKPYFLRRIKSEVLQLPPKNEVIVPLSMTPLQKEIYRSILSQNLDVLKHLSQVSTIRAGVSKTNMNNMLMQLRKCIQHPYLISDDIEPRGLGPQEAHEKLIDASAKLRLLKSLLPKLKARGHRVLLFSQFVIALDIVEDFLRGENYKYLRLDGETKQAIRQKGMDDFNKPDSEYFIYLLTTRAGGVGINLYTADTVIIFDPDFNPHQDLQAIARAHRYGQQKTCLVFKLMVKDTAEERIMQAGKKKLVLDHLIVQKMDDDESSDDLTSILTFGARALFEEGDQSSKDIVYNDNDLDKLIEKTEVEGEGEEQDIVTEPGLKFNFAKVWAAEKDVLEDLKEAVPDVDQGDSWAQALERIAASKHAIQEKEVTGRGVRRKAAAAFPRQQLEFLDGPDDTPAKDKSRGKKKGRILKSGTSSDSDAYDASAHRAGDDTDATTESMDAEPALSSTPELSKKQRRDQAVSFPTATSGSTPPHDNVQKCGLCGCIHGSGACMMTESNSNLVEYREILMNHTSDEPWEYRKLAIEAIEQRLYARGQGQLLAGQPLKLVSKPGPSSKSVKTNRSGKRGETSRDQQNPTSSQLPAHMLATIPPAPVIGNNRGNIVDGNSTVLPSKRMSSPSEMPGNLAKKQKQSVFSGCPVCLGSQHPVEDCPVINQDTNSITKHIVRLSEDASQKRVVKKLRRLLKQRKQESEAAEQSGHDRMRTSA